MSKKKNAMGYIYPGKIRSLLRGESSKVVSGYTPSGSTERKVGDRWVDVNDVEWEQRNGYAIKVTKLDDARIPLFCPKCKRVMRKRKDVDIYLKFGFCLDCLAERDTKMMIKGTFWDYEKQYVLDKKINFLNEAKQDVEEYLKNLSDEITFANEDGTLEKWNIDSKEAKKFLEKELKEINKELEKLELERKSA